jgi:hypothetical protein
MKLHRLIFVLLVTGLSASAQNPAAEQDTPFKTRYSLAVIDDATFYSNLRGPSPEVLNQMLVEPTFDLRYRDRWKLSTSLIGSTTTYSRTTTKLHVKEAYAGLSAGDFDFTMGRKIVRWGTGYAFTAAGVLDPPRDPTNPTDRLNVNQGRDMIKADWARGPHALTLAWSTNALAPPHSNLHDTTAFRYNVLVRGFDTSLMAGNNRGADTFGALTFTRVLGQAWEVHGEAAWSEQGALLVGGKYTTRAGVTFIGELFTQPDTPYFRDMLPSPVHGRQNYGLFNVGKARLRELPGWKEWDASGSIVADLNDQSFTAVVDASRWFGNHFSSYVHMEIPYGDKASVYGSAPYSTSTSLGIRFHL